MTLDSISKDPIKNLALGNSFPKEYDFYKYKQDGFNQTLTEKENVLLLIQAYRFVLFDIGYVLDLEPNNTQVFEYYQSLQTDYNKLLDYYEHNYGILSHCTDVKKSSYTYLNPPFLGDK